jgi:hypothetical protein
LSIAAEAIMVHTPRPQRDLERMRRAAQAAGGGQASAMTVALAEIGAAFDEAAVVNAFKMRVERTIRLGAAHPAVQARYRARAAMLSGSSLATAIVIVERWWRDERKAFQIASAFGGGTRLSVEILRELRLILRLMRSSRMEAAFREIQATICGTFAAAAE